MKKHNLVAISLNVSAVSSMIIGLMAYQFTRDFELAVIMLLCSILQVLGAIYQSIGD